MLRNLCQELQDISDRCLENGLPYLCKSIRIRDTNMAIEPVYGNCMKLSGDQATRGYVAKHIVDSPCIIIMDQSYDFVKNLIWHLIERRILWLADGRRRWGHELVLLLLQVRGKDVGRDRLGLEERHSWGVERRIILTFESIYIGSRIKGKPGRHHFRVSSCVGEKGGKDGKGGYAVLVL